MQTPPQNPPAPNQYPNQQQQWGQQSQYEQQYGPGQQQWDQQQQWNQQQQLNVSHPDKRPAGSGKKGLKQDAQPGLWQQIVRHKSAIIKIVAALVVIGVLIGLFSSFSGEVGKLVSKPVVASFEASSGTITEGESANLKWNVSGTSSVTITPNVGAVPSSGSKTVSPTKTTTYTLVASNTFGSTQQTMTIEVTGALPSITNFSLNPANIVAGQSTKLSWSVTGATSVSINPTVGTVSPSGSQNVTPSMTTTYTLTASNEAGNITKSATVTVTASDSPFISIFTASPATIKAGESSTLEWDVIGSTSININQGVGGVGAKSKMEVRPTATTTYTLTAGSATKSVQITVDTSGVQTTASSTIPTSPPAITSFSTSKNSITLGDNVTLTWAVTGAKFISISPDVGTVAASGSAVVTPFDEETTYTLTAKNNLGTVTDNVTVTVEATGDEVIPVIQSFTAYPLSVNAGETVKLSWNILRATAISIEPFVEMPESTFQNWQDVTVSENTTYTLTAINSGGRAIKSVTVNVH